MLVWVNVSNGGISDWHKIIQYQQRLRKALKDWCMMSWEYPDVLTDSKSWLVFFHATGSMIWYKNAISELMACPLVMIIASFGVLVCTETDNCRIALYAYDVLVFTKGCDSVLYNTPGAGSLPNFSQFTFWPSSKCWRVPSTLSFNLRSQVKKWL